jgi:hypothetical protein
MVAYIQALAKELAEILERAHSWGSDETLRYNISRRFRALSEEIDRLDPRDFAPVDQAKFVTTRMKVEAWWGIPKELWNRIRDQLAAGSSGSGDAIITELRKWLHHVEASEPTHQHAHKRDAYMATSCLVDDAAETCRALADVLNSYRSAGSHLLSRTFEFVHDAGLREIVVRDYQDLTVRVYPSRAWKSTVILAGSILEAVLYDQLTIGSTIPHLAMQWPSAPTKRGGVVRDILSDRSADKWELFHLIDVADHLQMLPEGGKATVHQVLREYRNFVHPRKEIRDGHACREPQAMMAVGALDGICDHFST